MDKQAPADIVLTPAACYQVYPIVAQRGTLNPGGHLVDVQSYCFRHEPSLEPTRMQLFRMREYVRIGTEEEVLAFRADWIERGRPSWMRCNCPMKWMWPTIPSSAARAS
jgi:seryl-tRNA synthetase